jgi:hypothetical protein
MVVTSHEVSDGGAETSLFSLLNCLQTLQLHNGASQLTPGRFQLSNRLTYSESANPQAQGRPDKLVFSLTYCDEVFERLSCTVLLELIGEEALSTPIRKRPIGKLRYQGANTVVMVLS